MYSWDVGGLPLGKALGFNETRPALRPCDMGSHGSLAAQAEKELQNHTLKPFINPYILEPDLRLSCPL